MKSATPVTKTKDKDTFITVTHKLSAAKHWISLTTGEKVGITSTEKLIWGYMKPRHDHFTKGGEYFDNQDDIALACACDVRTVSTFIRKLVKHGYLIVGKKQMHGFIQSNSYKVVSDLQPAPVELPKPTPSQEVEAPQEERVPAYEPILLPLAVKQQPTVVATLESPLAFIGPLTTMDHGGDEPDWELHM